MAEFDELKNLLRERDLVRRNDPDPRLYQGPNKGGLWRKLLGPLAKSEQDRARERWGSLLLDAVHPPPETAQERKMMTRNRSLSEIEADIAAIAPVRVSAEVFGPDDLPRLDGQTLLVRGCHKDYVIGAEKQKTPACFQIHCKTRPNMEQVAPALGARASYRETALSIRADRRDLPMRSTGVFAEHRVHDSAVRVDVDGRYWQMGLVLSQPLFGALTKLIPMYDTGLDRAVSHQAIGVVIDQDRPPRPIPLDDPEPLGRLEEVRIRRLYVFDLDWGEGPWHECTPRISQVTQLSERA